MTETGRWAPDRGWGWVWGPHDEVGALNALGRRETLAALSGIRSGQVFDLGVTVDRNSYLSPVHPHTEVLSFRSPEGVLRERDLDIVRSGAFQDELGFSTSMIMACDHLGTQLDGLAHITCGEDHHWYNGFNVAADGGDFGPRRAGAENIPPIIAHAVMIDVASWRGVPVLAPGTPIGRDDLEATLAAQGSVVRPGDVVMLRTGTLSGWGERGHDHDVLRGPDSSGLTLEGAKYLVESCGAVLLASDTSMVEVFPPVDGSSFHPVHHYALVEQGVHLGELHNLEELAAERIYECCYIALAPKIAGTTGGFAMRPIALI
ncbi:MAG TPA: cyclase family protein [Ilumatobacteraceae bacterium]|nr:cyclase family protein [Ilumatobacteraceae bacterium]